MIASKARDRFLDDKLKNIDIDSKELLWVDCSESGNREIAEKHLKATQDYWQEAHNIAETFTENDPRRAASLNNLAIIYRLRQNFEAAEKYYSLAKNAWIAANDWVKAMQIQSRAASSLFHLRMENKHRHAYNQPLINRYLVKLEAGYAATLNNHAELLQIQNHCQQARAQYALALEKRTAADLIHDRGVLRIENNLNARLHEDDKDDFPEPNDTEITESLGGSFIDQARREHWIIDKPPIFTDEGRLMAALLLTHVLDAQSLF